MSFEVPDACTLPTAARPLRLAEFDALFATALRRQERISARHLRMTLAGDDGLAETTRDLTARESACCSFFDFTITPTGDGVVLDIEVPAVHAAVLDGLSALATSAAPASTL
jgi:hypothetical protein